MLLGGDEFSRTQHGNNNAWCQDNELSWFDWDWDDDQRALLAFTRRLIRCAASTPSSGGPRSSRGAARRAATSPTSGGSGPDGRRMTQRDWRRGDVRAIGVFLNGEEIPLATPQGEPIADDSFLLLFNGNDEPIEFKLPTKRFGTRWQLELSTLEPDVAAGSRSYVARAVVPVESRTVVVLRRGW